LKIDIRGVLSVKYAEIYTRMDLTSQMTYDRMSAKAEKEIEMKRDEDGMLSTEAWYEIAEEAREHMKGWQWRADMMTPDQQIPNPDDPWLKASYIAQAWAGVVDGITEVLALNGLT